MSFAPEALQWHSRDHAGRTRVQRVRPAQVARWLQRLAGRRVAVVGDAILDEFLWGDTTRISPEAPVPVVLLERQEWCVGGAANVAANIAGLGGRATLFAAVGDDGPGERLADLLRAAGIEIGALPRLSGRPTTVKFRVLARNKHLLRFDREDTAPFPAAATRALAQALAQSRKGFDAVVVSDYAKGCVSRTLVAAVAAYCRRARIPWCVDPKATDLRFRAAAVLKPNLVELEALSGMRIRTEEQLRTAAARTLHRYGAAHLLVTRGSEGMMLCDRDGTTTVMRGGERRVADVTGAGDTVTAALGLGLAARLQVREAALLANLAGALAVAVPGTAAVDRASIAAELA